MIEYRQRIGKKARRKTDVWHSHSACQHWPVAFGSYVSRFKKPTTGEGCNECRRKRKRETA